MSSLANRKSGNYARSLQILWLDKIESRTMQVCKVGLFVLIKNFMPQIT